jgi:uncharacterized protein
LKRSYFVINPLTIHAGAGATAAAGSFRTRCASFAAAFLLGATLSLGAQAAPASEASITELLRLTKADTLVDGMLAHMEQNIRNGMQQAAAGKPLSVEQHRMMELAPAKLTALVREELSWDKLKPIYIQVYVETFEQAEVDGLIAFYRSPVGQAFVSKMPLVQQKSMAITQQRMQSFGPRMEAAMAELMEQIKSAQ